jgi:hypothetical protein
MVRAGTDSQGTHFLPGGIGWGITSYLDAHSAQSSLPISDLYTSAAIVPCSDIQKATITGVDTVSNTITIQLQDLPDCAIGEIVHMFQSK